MEAALEYGTPKNPRLMPAREDNNSGPVRKKFGKKRFGVRLTHRHMIWRMKRNIVWTQWYKKEAGRDQAYKHYKTQRRWLRPDELEFTKVEKIER